MSTKSEALLSLLGGQAVIPILQVSDARRAVLLARALAKGGLPLIEVTLRTPAALEAIRQIALQVEEAVVGAGTVLTAGQFHDAVGAGARFVVSPGFTPSLLETAAAADIPFLPGAATPGEIMEAREAGWTFLKFFPAAQSGGAAFLKALASPFPDIRFCPTGGISPANAPDYLALPNIACVGGSWIAPEALVEAEAWEQITVAARAASRLRESI